LRESSSWRTKGKERKGKQEEEEEKLRNIKRESEVWKFINKKKKKRD